MTTKIGITGSIASGKTTASKIISNNRGLLFSADKIVQNLYKKKELKKIIAKKFKIKLNSKFKAQLKSKILEKKTNLNKLERIIHPRVRKELLLFIKNNKNKALLFFEIPLLIESKLKHYFDKVIFIKSNKLLRQKRFKISGGDQRLFSFLDSNQIKDTKKMKLCDHIVVNNKTKLILKKKLFNIIKNYE
jgi:dephospho-CoA kinase